MDPSSVKMTVFQVISLIPGVLSGPVVALLIVLIFKNPIKQLLLSVAHFLNNYERMKKEVAQQTSPQPVSPPQPGIFPTMPPQPPRQQATPSTQMHQSLGQAFAMRGAYDEAISQYHQAIQLDSENASAYIGLGNAYHKKGLYQEAIKALEKAVEIKPYWADCRCNLGAAYSLADMHEKAVEEFVQAININPNYAAAHYGLGIAHTSAGNYEKAEEQVETLKELDSNFAEKLAKTVKDAKARSESEE
jgi:tetratricopeptide (TPR) repeat protein